MAYRLTYTVNSESWNYMVHDVRRAALDLTPALKRAGEYMLLEVDDRFRKEQDLDGNPWKPLSETTLLLTFERRGKRRALTSRGKESAGFSKYKSSKKILQVAGNRGGLRASITYRASSRALDHGTNKIYGAIHELGGDSGRGKKVHIDARPYLGYSERNINHIEELVLAHVLAAAK